MIQGLKRLKLIPPEVMAEARSRVADTPPPPRSRIGILAVLLVWTLAGLAASWWLAGAIAGRP